MPRDSLTFVSEHAAELAGRSFLVTGGNAGVGYASRLTWPGAAGECLSSAGRRRSRGGGRVGQGGHRQRPGVLVLLDLASLDSVRSARRRSSRWTSRFMC